MKIKCPTEAQAVKNMARNNVRMQRALKVAEMAIDACMADVRRR